MRAREGGVRTGSVRSTGVSGGDQRASSRGGHPNLRQLGDGLREGRGGGRGLSRREIFCVGIFAISSV